MWIGLWCCCCCVLLWPTLSTTASVDQQDILHVGSVSSPSLSGLLTFPPVSFFSTKRQHKSARDPFVMHAAQFAVDKVRQLSDSGIYETLELARIQQAAAEIGDFHYILHLQLALASPFFQSGKAQEDFELMVLTPKRMHADSDQAESWTHGVAFQSIAINEFPVMNQHAIEKFWIHKVETRRAQRRQLFHQWQQQADQAQQELQQQQQQDQQQHAPTENQEQTQPLQPPNDHDSLRLPDPPTEPIVIQAVASSSAAGATSSSSSSPPISISVSSNKKLKKKKLLTWQTLQQMRTKDLRQLLTKAEISQDLQQAIVQIIDERWDALQHLEQTQPTGRESDSISSPSDYMDSIVQQQQDEL